MNPNRPPVKHNLSYLLWLRITRVMQRVRRLAEHEIQETGLSGGQLAVLFELVSAEGLSQQQLADEMGLTKGNITQLLEKLEIEGLIRRERNGRENHLHLTERGREIAHQYLTAQQAFIEARFSVLSVEEQAQLLTLLRKLERTLG